jgi:hypothetical protein
VADVSLPHLTLTLQQMIMQFHTRISSVTEYRSIEKERLFIAGNLSFYKVLPKTLVFYQIDVFK